MTPAAAADPLLACLCAAWCRLCDGYGPLFEQAVTALQRDWPTLQSRWIDIEDEAELVGELDVETFPTLVLVTGRRVLFAGALTPQPEVLQRVLGRALVRAGQGEPPPAFGAEVEAFARRLRSGAGGGPAQAMP